MNEWPSGARANIQSIVVDGEGLIPALFALKTRAAESRPGVSTVNTHTGWKNLYQVCHKRAQLLQHACIIIYFCFFLPSCWGVNGLQCSAVGTIYRKLILLLDLSIE